MTSENVNPATVYEATDFKHGFAHGGAECNASADFVGAVDNEARDAAIDSVRSQQQRESGEEGDFDSLGDEAFGEDVGHCVEAGEGRLGSAWASELCIAEISDWIGPRVRTTINSCAQLDDG